MTLKVYIMALSWDRYRPRRRHRHGMSTTEPSVTSSTRPMTRIPPRNTVIPFWRAPIKHGLDHSLSHQNSDHAQELDLGRTSTSNFLGTSRQSSAKMTVLLHRLSHLKKSKRLSHWPPPLQTRLGPLILLTISKCQRLRYGRIALQVFEFKGWFSNWHCAALRVHNTACIFNVERLRNCLVVKKSLFLLQH